MMRCPRCGDDLSLREYVWLHRHTPHPLERKLGAALMMVGGFVAGTALLEKLGVFR